MKMAIPIIHRASYVTETYTVVSLLFLEAKKKDYSSDPYLQELLITGETVCDCLLKSIDYQKVESELKFKSDNRKEKFSRLIHSVEGYTYNPDEQVAIAAKEIEKVLNNFGLKIVRQNYAKQTAQFQTLLSNLAEESLKESIGKLDGVEKLIVELTESQDEFVSYWLEYKNKQKEEDKQKCASVLKKELLTIMNKKLLPYVNQISLSQPLLYGNLCESWTKIVSDHNSLIRARILRNKGKKSADDEGSEDND